MSNYSLKKPLIQSAVVLVAFLAFILFVYSAQPDGIFGGIAAIILGIFSTIQYFFGLLIGLVVSLATLIAIFFITIALYSTSLAADYYSSFKQELFGLVSTFTGGESMLEQAGKAEEENQKLEASLDRAASEKAGLLDRINQLNGDLQTVQSQISSLRKSVEEEKEANNELNEKLTAEEEKSTGLEESLAAKETTIAELTASNKELTDQVAEASEQGDDTETLEAELASLKEENETNVQTIKELEENNSGLSTQIEELVATISQLQGDAEKSPEAGIFSYIDDESDKQLFIDKIDEAIEQKMTYAQIDEFLTQELSKELDTIIKDHPSLTKNYIRNKRR